MYVSLYSVNLHGASPVVSRQLCLFQAMLAPNPCFQRNARIMRELKPWGKPHGFTPTL